MLYYFAIFLIGLGMGLWLNVVGLGLATALLILVCGSIELFLHTPLSTAVQNIAISAIILQLGYFVAVVLQLLRKPKQD